MYIKQLLSGEGHFFNSGLKESIMWKVEIKVDLPKIYWNVHNC